MRRVTVFVAPGCHLCERALEVVGDLHAELSFELDVVDITGDPVLEDAHRAYLPVVEIDGDRAFTYVVAPDALRARVAVPAA